MKQISSRRAVAVWVTALVCHGAFTQAEPTETAGSTNQSQASTGLDEIIVTAQRRAESMQSVPVAVTAFKGSDLTNLGVQGTQDLVKVVPSLFVAQNANGVNFFLRGVGSSLGNANSEGSVALYIDGVYQAAPFADNFQFDNIKSIEVLKGPQGTLFGRNATGGVINIATSDPSDHLTGSASVGYGNYDTTDASANISIPLSSDVGISISGRYKDRHDGFGYDLGVPPIGVGERIIGDREVDTRMKLVATPGDSTRLVVSAAYFDTTNPGYNAQQLPGTVNAAGLGYPGKYNNWDNQLFYNNAVSEQIAGTLEQKLGPVKLVSISSYTNAHSIWTIDQDSSPVEIVNVEVTEFSKTLSQEFHIESNSASPLTWLAGVFYFDNRAGMYPLQLQGLATESFGPALNSVELYAQTRQHSIAGFGQASYEILPATNLTIGARETYEKTLGSGFVTGNGSADIASTFYPGAAPLFAPAYKQFSYDKPSWRVALDHHFTPDLMSYISINRGIKSGSMNIAGGSPALLPYQPEDLTAYEIGTKTEWLDHRLRLNAAAYYYDYKNLQFDLLVNGGAIVANAPSATNYGLDMDLTAVVAEGLNVNASLGLLKSRFGNFPNAPNTNRLPSGATGTGSPTFNADGNRLPYAPAVTASLGAQYLIPTQWVPGSIGKFTLSTNANYFGGAPPEPDNRLYIDSYTVLGASLTWADPSDRIELRLWGDNLTDRYYYVLKAGVAGLIDVGTPGTPRTYGIRGTFKF